MTELLTGGHEFAVVLLGTSDDLYPDRQTSGAPGWWRSFWLALAGRAGLNEGDAARSPAMGVPTHSTADQSAERAPMPIEVDSGTVADQQRDSTLTSRSSHTRPDGQTSSGNLPTHALVEAARAGSEQAWFELTSRFTGHLRATVMRFNLNSADTDDVIQSTWLRAVEGIHQLKDPEVFGDWLRTIARRESLALIRRRQREVDLTAMPDASSGVEQKWSDPGGGEPTSIDALERLPATERELLRLLLLDAPLSYAEISRQTGMPIGSIGPTRARALRRLRGELAAEESQERPPG